MADREAKERAVEAVGRMYFFLLSDAFRELREAEVRWECFAASQYHFDDGVKFILEAVEPEVPVDHPIWTLYSEKVTEVGARVAHAEERKLEKLAAVKGVQQAFLRLCRDRRLDPGKVTDLDAALPERVLEALKDEEVAADGAVAEASYKLLQREWDKYSPVPR